jgi:hypothetical protein
MLKVTSKYACSCTSTEYVYGRSAGGKGAACDATFFKRREFCFTLDGDIFARYKSFQVRFLPDTRPLALL